jgi:hypothetical protein
MKKIITGIMVVFLISLMGCLEDNDETPPSKSDIYGSWDDEGLGDRYTFNENDTYVLYEPYPDTSETGSWSLSGSTISFNVSMECSGSCTACTGSCTYALNVSISGDNMTLSYEGLSTTYTKSPFP